MKIFKTICVMVVFLFCMQTSAFSDSVDYETDGQVGFYGEYIYETEETEETEETKETEKVITPSKPESKDNKQFFESARDKLPATGEKKMNTYSYLGGALGICSLFMFYIIKRKGE